MHTLIACAVLVAATASPIPLTAGTSFADAIVIQASNEDAGVAAEYQYLRAHPCDGGTWRVTQQALAQHGGKPYDVLTARCSTNGATRAFFFDISSYFGKM
jgi:hypothetical protein